MNSIGDSQNNVNPRLSSGIIIVLSILDALGIYALYPVLIDIGEDSAVGPFITFINDYFGIKTSEYYIALFLFILSGNYIL